MCFEGLAFGPLQGLANLLTFRVSFGKNVKHGGIRKAEQRVDSGTIGEYILRSP